MGLVVGHLECRTGFIFHFQANIETVSGADIVFLLAFIGAFSKFHLTGFKFDSLPNSMGD